MRLGAVIAGVVGAVALVTVAGQASAQAAQHPHAPAMTLAEAAAAQRAANAAGASPQRGLRWNGRWGLNFNLNQPVGRENDWGDVEAGAFYRVNPRLSVGAAAGLGPSEQDPTRAPETDRRSQPRVRLESIFRF